MIARYDTLSNDPASRNSTLEGVLERSLLLDGSLGKRFDFEARVRNRGPAFDGPAVGASRDALLRASHHIELSAKVRRKSQGHGL